MAETNAPPPKSGGSGPFIGAAVVMLLLMGGLVFWKMSGGEKPKADAAPPAQPSVEQAPVLDQPPPPPPPPAPEPTASTAPEKTEKKVSSGSVGGGCSSCGKCTGEAAAGFASAARSRGAQARRCYEKALAQQESLQGKMSVNLCVGANGQVCGASIGSDSLGSPLVSQCVLNIFRATTFPAPKNGCIDASVPLNFMPGK
jgi:outer membrane biosynthesis protein TonB